MNNILYQITLCLHKTTDNYRPNENRNFIMKIIQESKIITLVSVLTLICYSCIGIHERNIVVVKADAAIDLAKIKIEHYKRDTSIRNYTDAFYLKNRDNNSTVYEKGTISQVPNNYGENDFLVTYKDSLYVHFRQFKTNRQNQHTYHFSFTKEKSSYFVAIDITGKNNLATKLKLIPIHQAFNFNNSKLRNNFFSSPSKCFDNLYDYSFDENKFKTSNGIIFKNKINGSTYILTCDNDGHMYLRSLNVELDYETINQQGEFWKDKNSVYGNYTTSDGDMLYQIKNADVHSFESFDNSIYGKDKNFVFTSRHGKMENVDINTFIPIYSNNKRIASYGKDKNNYFFLDDRIEDTTAINSILKNQNKY